MASVTENPRAVVKFQARGFRAHAETLVSKDGRFQVQRDSAGWWELFDHTQSDTEHPECAARIAHCKHPRGLLLALSEIKV